MQEAIMIAPFARDAQSTGSALAQVTERARGKGVNVKLSPKESPFPFPSPTSSSSTSPAVSPKREEKETKDKVTGSTSASSGFLHCPVLTESPKLVRTRSKRSNSLTISVASEFVTRDVTQNGSDRERQDGFDRVKQARSSLQGLLRRTMKGASPLNGGSHSSSPGSSALEYPAPRLLPVNGDFADERSLSLEDSGPALFPAFSSPPRRGFAAMGAAPSQSLKLSAANAEEGVLERAMREADEGLRAGVPPMRIEGCTSGAYYLRNRRRTIVAVFKPCAEEPGAMALNSMQTACEERIQQYDFGVKPSDSLAAREVLAAIVSSESSGSSAGSQRMWNRGSGSSVPPTTLAYVRHPAIRSCGSAVIASKDLHGSERVRIRNNFDSMRLQPGDFNDDFAACSRHSSESSGAAAVAMTLSTSLDSDTSGGAEANEFLPFHMSPHSKGAGFIEGGQRADSFAVPSINLPATQMKAAQHHKFDRSGNGRQKEGHFENGSISTRIRSRTGHQRLNDTINDSSKGALGSFQLYVSHLCSAEDVGASTHKLFPTREVHRLGLLDLRMLNLDRHLGNVLVRTVSGECQRATRNKGSPRSYVVVEGSEKECGDREGHCDSSLCSQSMESRKDTKSGENHSTSNPEGTGFSFHGLRTAAHPWRSRRRRSREILAQQVEIGSGPSRPSLAEGAQRAETMSCLSSSMPTTSFLSARFRKDQARSTIETLSEARSPPTESLTRDNDPLPPRLSVDGTEYKPTVGCASVRVTASTSSNRSTTAARPRLPSSSTPTSPSSSSEISPTNSRQFGDFRFVPIDHGFTLPRLSGLNLPRARQAFETEGEIQEGSRPLFPEPALSRLEFAWAAWPQSEEPFDRATLQHVESLNAWRDIERIEKSARGAVANLVHEDSYERWDYYLTLLTATAMVRLCAGAGLTLKEIATLFCGRSDRDGERTFKFDFLSVLDEAIALAGLEQQEDIAWMCATEGMEFAKTFCRCFENAATAALADL